MRPWQHVLEPLCGYLLLAERLADDPAGFGEAWNFGPAEQDAREVGWIAQRIIEQWGDGARWIGDCAEAPHESIWLKVDASRARLRLGWAPRLRLADALDWTVDWHRRLVAGRSARVLMDEQLERYHGLEPATA